MSMEALYQDIILDHYKNPRNFRKLDHIPEDQVFENPSCGDSLKLEVKIENGIIQSVSHESSGCAISVSSASMMTALLSGKTVAEAQNIVARFLAAFRGEVEGIPEEYDDLLALEGVIKYPLRVKCATLAWHALDTILKSQS